MYESKDKTITNDFLFSCDVSSYDNLSDYGLILTQTRLLPAHSPAVCLRVWEQIRAKILLMEKSTLTKHSIDIACVDYNIHD